VGAYVGHSVGEPVPRDDTFSDGDGVGDLVVPQSYVGSGVGNVGESVGDGVGLGVGFVGEYVGDSVGLGVGDSVGSGVGICAVGLSVGDSVGESVGLSVGYGVGDGVGAKYFACNASYTMLPSASGSDRLNTTTSAISPKNAVNSFSKPVSGSTGPILFPGGTP
jgi:hypothetical protein